MALWTPYADEVALDLSKPVVKEERLTPEVVTSIGYPMSDLVPVDVIYPRHYEYFGYQYPHTTAYAGTSTSPVFGGSTCSGYESAPVPEPLVSPQYVTTAGPLSPPESPVPPRDMEVDELSDDPDFLAYERNALRVMAEKNGGALLANNPRMRRAVKSTNQNAANDSYRKQRERNNFAAKQSRDRRKLKEIHLALKVSYLKNEMASLKAKLAAKVCGCCRQQCLC